MSDLQFILKLDHDLPAISSVLLCLEITDGRLNTLKKLQQLIELALAHELGWFFELHWRSVVRLDAADSHLNWMHVDAEAERLSRIDPRQKHVLFLRRLRLRARTDHDLILFVRFSGCLCCLLRRPAVWRE